MKKVFTVLLVLFFFIATNTFAIGNSMDMNLKKNREYLYLKTPSYLDLSCTRMKNGTVTINFQFSDISCYSNVSIFIGKQNSKNYIINENINIITKAISVNGLEPNIEYDFELKFTKDNENIELLVGILSIEESNNGYITDLAFCKFEYIPQDEMKE